MLIPALDVLEGQIVRLKQGSFAQPTMFSTDPVAAARSYAEQGADYLHIVDLSGARQPSSRQTRLITQMHEACQIPVQSGGGLRSSDDIARLLNSGIHRAVIGSVAVEDPIKARKWLSEFGSEALVFALDIMLDKEQKRWLKTQGWQQSSHRQLEDVLDALLSSGCKHVLCTDIQRDGMLGGPNVKLYEDLKKEYPQIHWQASGGISQLSDLGDLKQAGCDSVILGKALLQGNFNLQEASLCWQNG